MYSQEEVLKSLKQDYSNIMLGGFVSCFVFTPIVGIPAMIIIHLLLNPEIKKTEEFIKNRGIA